MGLRRKHASRSVGYRQGYLRSAEWAKFRAGFYGRLRAANILPACAACGRAENEGVALELHHLSYEGVRQLPGGQWVSGERDDDVILLCRDDHEQVHRILDSNPRDFSGLSRRVASLRIINSLRARYGRLTFSRSGGNTGRKR